MKALYQGAVSYALVPNGEKSQTLKSVLQNKLSKTGITVVE